jgi:hypothetical protein
LANSYETVKYDITCGRKSNLKTLFSPAVVDKIVAGVNEILNRMPHFYSLSLSNSIFILFLFIIYLFGQGYAYKPPAPLTSGLGAKWESQHSSNLKSDLYLYLCNHFNYWKERDEDKVNHPLFFLVL